MILCVASLLAGGGAAKAETRDSSNPVHCGVAFAVYHHIAKVQGLKGAEMFEKQMHIEAARARALPPSKRNRAEGIAFGTRLAADPDATYKLVVECLKRRGVPLAGL
jgi:hypothetical protein